MNILVNSCDEYICVSMEYIARSGIAGSQNMFSFRKYCQDVFNVVVPPKVVVWRAQAPCWCLALSVFIVLLYFILFFILESDRERVSGGGGRGRERARERISSGLHAQHGA